MIYYPRRLYQPQDRKQSADTPFFKDLAEQFRQAFVVFHTFCNKWWAVAVYSIQVHATDA